jgi:hypothetical protein
VSGTSRVSGAEEKVRLRTEMRFARRVIEQLDTPWLALFAAVETAYDDNVTLLGVEPEPERREVRLIAEAKDVEAMLAYVRQVRQSPVLRDAWLANHQVNQQDPLRPVRFSIIARWLSPSVKPASTIAVSDAPREEITAGTGQVVGSDTREKETVDVGQVVADDTSKEAAADAGQLVADAPREEITTGAGQVVASDTREEETAEVGQAVASDPREAATIEVGQVVADDTSKEAAADAGQVVVDAPHEEEITTDVGQEGGLPP